MATRSTESSVPSTQSHPRVIHASGNNVNATCNSSYSALPRPSNTLSGILLQVRAPSASQPPTTVWSTLPSLQPTSCNGSISAAAGAGMGGTAQTKHMSTFTSKHLAESNRPVTRTITISDDTSRAHASTSATAPSLVGDMSNSRESGHIDSAAIAGVAIGAVLLLALLAACAFYLGRRSKAVQIHFEPAALQREHQRAPSALGRLRSRLRNSVDSVIMLGAASSGNLHGRRASTPGLTMYSGTHHANELIPDRKASFHAKVEEVRSLQGSRSHPALRALASEQGSGWSGGFGFGTKTSQGDLHSNSKQNGGRPFRNSV